MKHTPGPWTAISNELGTFIRCKNDYLITGPINDRPDGIDNARLIAAAPDLLEALIYCRQKIAYMMAHGEWASPGRAIEIADAAIAKAQGEI